MESPGSGAGRSEKHGPEVHWPEAWSTWFTVIPRRMR